MTKEVTITLNYDPDIDSRSNHDMECITTVNGTYYHNCLLEVYDIIMKGIGLSKPTKAEQKLLDEIRRAAAPHFKGLYHEET